MLLEWQRACEAEPETRHFPSFLLHPFGLLAAIQAVLDCRTGSVWLLLAFVSKEQVKRPTLPWNLTFWGPETGPLVASIATWTGGYPCAKSLRHTRAYTASISDSKQTDI